MQSKKSGFTKGGNRNGMMQPRRRRRKIKTPPGHPTDEDLISAYLKNDGKVTKCPSGYAMGSLPSTSFGLE